MKVANDNITKLIPIDKQVQNTLLLAYQALCYAQEALNDAAHETGDFDYKLEGDDCEIASYQIAQILTTLEMINAKKKKV